ncbi:AsmA family protein [Roseibium denhamense]|uniref:Uncharacterized protein involved in outer membrane biogenesis n=1 Tax=Roseibium denhamense TaxID=76305 RepID=A0ABY1P9I8_9HYPH|nr:AsmA family protein [Roseibium denhamense]MTI07427.1 AsmA family protein [Roseibium denhamense]SMP29578.1 Uncharacterized protein involved in outer membrane biogenesis [Roseibium denhamense]
MRRLLIGLGGFFFVLVTIIMVVPFLLPKEEIKRQVIAEVDKRFGWRVRLDGPVSLSLFPNFSLTAENIGLSGEAGADGIEFAKADRMDFALAWGGLLSGDVQVNGIGLAGPQILLETGPNGVTSWEPRRDLPGPGSGEGAAAPAETAYAGTEVTSPEQNGLKNAPTGGGQGYLKRIGVDRVAITDGTLTYKDPESGETYVIRDLDLTLLAPDLEGRAELDSSFTFQDTPLTVAGSLTNPIGLASGDQVPFDMTAASGENTLAIFGDGGLSPARVNLKLTAGGPSLAGLAALAGQDLQADTGAYSLEAQLAGSAAALSVADLHLTLGALSLGGAADADLSGLVPEVSGRLVLKEGSVADLMALSGQDLPASGTLSADLAFETVGMTAAELMAGLDLNGSVSIAGGEVGGLGLSSAVGGDPEADRITNLAMDVELQGLEAPIAATGTLSWRGEGFSLTGRADTGKLLAGSAAPVSMTIKSSRVSAGFDGQATVTGAVDGAVRVETADLPGLMAWMGQPVGAGNGLKTFKASGIFGVQGETISFEETRFTLDETSGEANGRIQLGAKPKVTARLALRELVLDPYLGSQSAAGKAQPGAAGSAGQANTATQTAALSGWSTAPIDFSGLSAIDADFSLTTQELRWDKIKVGESALALTIQNGVLNASLDRLALYGGAGTGAVTLNGTGAAPKVTAKFSLSGLDAYPLLRDAADFEWIEGKAAVMLDVSASGGSEMALVQSLSGTANYQFADGAIRGINVPKMVRGLSVETLLGWQENPSAKTDFSSLGATFQIESGIARTDDLSLIGPLVRMSGKGTTDLPKRTLAWRVEPRIVPTLEGQAPTPRRKGEDKKLAGLGVPIVIDGSWDNPRIYPDIAGILENPEAAYKQLQQVGGELLSVLKGDKPASEQLVDTANEVIQQATGGRTQIDVQKVIEGDVDDEEILKAVEEGFGLPQGLLGNVFGGQKKNDN